MRMSDKEIIEVNFGELGVFAMTKLSSAKDEIGPNRINLIVDGDAKQYRIPMSKANARWLIDALKDAVKLA